MTTPDPADADTMQAIFSAVADLARPVLAGLGTGWNVYDDDPPGPSVPCGLVHEDEDAITYSEFGFDDGEDLYGIVLLLVTGPIDSPESTKVARRLMSRHGPLIPALEGGKVDDGGSVLTVVKARLGMVEIGSYRYKSASIHCTTLSS